MMILKIDKSYRFGNVRNKFNETNYRRYAAIVITTIPRAGFKIIVLVHERRFYNFDFYANVLV